MRGIALLVFLSIGDDDLLRLDLPGIEAPVVTDGRDEAVQQPAVDGVRARPDHIAGDSPGGARRCFVKALVVAAAGAAGQDRVLAAAAAEEAARPAVVRVRRVALHRVVPYIL
eukprot:CAMPEP_0179184976 /NCGR_PEP_ID=MMETSP0796-20121207/91720_1 /TAXON_ID=73915 /ORGANISM="Pyrodinium bahamense, Strain pbaha01" /LENGTH=112 /DNA_ID=CAMNT_0020888929 /DNA_START=178 /DNA_END=512 /DNA_ORIENTATION=-